MKCPNCGGTGKEYWNGNVFCNTGFECDKCNGTGEIEMTNDEWRKTCSAEEFAEWISSLSYACMRCGMSNGEAYCHTGHCIQDEADAVEWLKQPHKPFS
jgi:hypothetical protein